SFLALRPSGAKQLAKPSCSDANCGRTSAAAVGIAAAPMAVAAPCPYCDQDPDAWQRSTKTPPPAISGTAAAVLDGACGRLIFGLNPNDRHPPASIAKIVSALVVSARTQPADKVPVKINGWDLAAADGSSIAGLLAGTTVSVEDLL